jgi:hypothetical protein
MGVNRNIILHVVQYNCIPLVYLFDYFRSGPRGTWHRSFWMSPSMKRSESAGLVTSVKKKSVKIMFTHAPLKIKLSSYMITHASLRA